MCAQDIHPQWTGLKHVNGSSRMGEERMASCCHNVGGGGGVAMNTDNQQPAGAEAQRRRIKGCD